MITTEQILELEHFSSDNGAECAWTDFAATNEQLVAFAQAVYGEGYNEGCFEATGEQ